LLYYFLEPGVRIYIGGQISSYVVQDIHKDFVSCMINSFYIGEINKIEIPIEDSQNLILECEYIGPRGYNKERDKEMQQFLDKNFEYE
jgi:hypothetical protein